MVTVRAWFRLQRAALWARDPKLAKDIDTIAVACLDTGTGPWARGWIPIGPVALITAPAEYATRERVIALVRRDLREALRHA